MGYVSKFISLFLPIFLIGLVMSGCGTSKNVNGDSSKKITANNVSSERTLQGYIFKVEKDRFLFAVVPRVTFEEMKGKATKEIITTIDPKKYQIYWMNYRDTSTLREGDHAEVTVHGKNEVASLPGQANAMKVRKTNETMIRGYVIKVEKDKILLGENLTHSEFNQIKDLSVGEILEKTNTIMFWLKSADAEDFRAGDKIAAWFQGPIDEPNPAFAEASKIELEK